MTKESFIARSMTLYIFWGIQMSCAQNEKIKIPAPLKDRSEIILKRMSYTISYNKETKIPNWVAWHLTEDHAYGNIKRFGGYMEDAEVERITGMDFFPALPD